MIVPNQMVEVKWNNANRKHYESKGYRFTCNGDVFLVKVEHLTKTSKSYVKFECDNCGVGYTRKYGVATRYKNQFCNSQCGSKYNGKILKSKRIRKECEWCSIEYYIPKNLDGISRFCGKDCMDKWRAEAFKGSGSSKYVERIEVNCDWCKKSLLRTPYLLSTREFNFCDKECKDNYHREIYVKTENHIQMLREITLNNIKEGKYKCTDTEPHRKTQEILNNLNINFSNERIIGDYAFDIYLEEFNIIIEVNGGYWHCDSRLYNKIAYEVQLNRIIQDKKKRTFINTQGIPVLYLWELDINNNPLLCEKLIKNFIDRHGKLEEYHSSSYHIDKNGELKIDNDPIKQYAEWEYNDMKELIDISVREKITRYDPSKNVIFECDNCGKLKEQNLKYYNSRKNHFCSSECKNIFQQNSKSDRLGVTHPCNNCGTVFRVQNYRYQNYLNGKTKSLCCSRKCQHEYSVGKKRS